MKRTVTALVAIATLVACATPSDIRHPIMSLNGKNLKEVIQLLGIPHNEQNIAGMRVISYTYREAHVSGNDFFCEIRLVASGDDQVTKVDINSNSMYYCPRLDRKQ